MLNNLTVKSRLISLISIPILGCIVLLLVTLVLTKDLVSRIQAINENQVIPLKQIKSVSDNYAVTMVDSFHKYNAGIITKNDLLKIISRAEERADSQWKALKNTKLTSKESDIVAKAEKLLVSVKSLLSEYKRKLISGSTLYNNHNEFVMVLYNTVDPLSESLNSLIELKLEDSSLIVQESVEEYEMEQTYLISVTVLLIFIVGAFARLIYKSIVLPLQGVNEIMAKIANDTDLTIRIDASGKDEFSNAASSTNKMLTHFKGLIENLLNAIAKLTKESEQMSSSSSKVANVIDEQEQQTHMIATAITEMSSAIAEVASNAVNTSHKANESDSIARQGLKKVSDNIVAISQLNDVIMSTKSDIDALSDKSNEINSVVQLIQSVAEQTNLLALNAAIEAARAGESGRGFAVVADEVRQLAHNTQEATEQISNMIIALQDASSRAVNSMETASNKAQESVDIANESSSSIESLADAIAEIADMNLVVSTATEEQTTVANEISESINSFSDSIRQVTTSTSEMAQTGNALLVLAKDLNSNVSQFKI